MIHNRYLRAYDTETIFIHCRKPGRVIHLSLLPFHGGSCHDIPTSHEKMVSAALEEIKHSGAFTI
jgi:hypothetical protein